MRRHNLCIMPFTSYHTEKTNVLEHLTSNNLLTSHQFGFLRSHSCTTQLLHVTDILTKSLDQGVPVDIIYIDLQKAFDF